MSDIQLNFINKSSDMNNSQIVIFQKNSTSSFNENPIAWKVIEYCGQNDNHPFVYKNDLEIASSDSYGNYTPKHSASCGMVYEIKMEPSGQVLTSKGFGNKQNEIQVINSLNRGGVNIHVYRSGKLLTEKSSIAPSQHTTFELLPHILIGVVSEVVEGETMKPAVHTELSLQDMKSADIVMTGGGSGSNATTFKFHLENIVML